MPAMMPYTQSFRPALMLLISVTAGCAQVATEHAANTHNADYFIVASRAGTGDDVQANKLSALEALVREGRSYEAADIAQQLGSAHWNTRDEIRFVLAATQAHVSVKNARLALQTLDRIAVPTQLPVAELMLYQDLRAQALAQTGNAFEAAALRMQLAALLQQNGSDESRKKNNASIWALLSSVSVADLQARRNSLTSPLLAGWIDLAVMHQKFANSPDALQNAVNVWRVQYPQHPGLDIPVTGIASEMPQIPMAQINHMALLLPLSGKLAATGKVLRDGFITALYENKLPDLQLRIYDAARGDINAIYDQAVSDGAQAIIGPLQKEQVQQLALRQTLPVPTLSLNVVDSGNATQLFQFGLPVEDEAQQVVARAVTNYKRALIFASDDTSGERSAQAMSAALSAAGAQTVGVVKLGKDDKSEVIAALVSRALGVESSMAREKALQQALGTELEFRPRRRQDVDVILIAAKPSATRGVKPFINAAYGQDLPMLGTSYLFSGNVSATLDSDLEGVEFCDMPWLIDNSPVRVAQREHFLRLWPVSTADKGRLFALGFDAFQLMFELPRLQLAPDYSIAGQSGKLSLDGQGHIHRRLSWARFQNGQLSAVNAADAP